MSNYTIYADGYSSPHKHTKAGWAIWIEKDSHYLASYIHAIDPLATNNEAELHGLINALRHALALKQAQVRINFKAAVVGHPCGISVQIRGDSQLATGLVNGTKHTKIKRLAILARYGKRLYNRLLIQTGGNSGIYWIPREDNKAGHLIERTNHNG